MVNGRVIFFFVLLAIVVAIARYNSPRSNPAPAAVGVSSSPVVSESPAAIAAPSASVSPAQNAAAASPAAAPSASPVAAGTPAAQPSISPSVALQKTVPRVAPAVAMISVFDSSGKLLRTGMGCFVSRDGRLMTSASLVEGAANAVAKVADGRIINISGMLANSTALDLSVLQVDTKKGVSYVSPNKSATTDAGIHVAVVGSPLRKQQPAYIEGAIPGRGTDEGGSWFDVGAAVPKECIGAPVVNEKGDLVGLITSRRPTGAVGDVARKAEGMEALLASINPNSEAGWQVADNNPPPPAEGPTPTPTASPNRFAKIPVVQSDRGKTRLIYSPRPAYPTSARHSYFPTKGNGRYRVSFDATGGVKEVTVLESTRSETLDTAAVDALRRWKAAPGQEWNATVPITFTP